MKRSTVSSIPVLVWLIVVVGPWAAAAPETAPRVREPAVAGLFYPKAPAELSQTIDRLLAASEKPAEGELKALIAPHAGYTYSGPVAAQAFRLLTNRHYATVLVMGPSHYALTSAASVSGAEVYRTPLGDVPVSPKTQALGKLPPFELEARATVERPNWWKQASHGEPPDGRETADTWEHSVEVEVPFLQKALGSFSLIPVVVGEVDPARAARALQGFVEDDMLIIASSDLSHYHPYAAAQALDQRCVDAILRLDTAEMARQEACGKNPVLTLLHLAKQRGWKPRLLDLRNSGDTAGDKTSVVGYAAIAFYAEPSLSKGETYRVDERRRLLQLARDAVRAAASKNDPPQVPADQVTPKLREFRGTFVTLKKNGALRGCIGHLDAREPLYQDVIDNARAAALEDPRFSPVTPREVDRLEIEVSVLTVPRPLAFRSPDDLLEKLHPPQDGVVLQIGERIATYLPQVWEQISDKTEFLNTLAEKAGAAPEAWRGRNTTVSIYHVEEMSEAEFKKVR